MNQKDAWFELEVGDPVILVRRTYDAQAGELREYFIAVVEKTGTYRQEDGTTIPTITAAAKTFNAKTGIGFAPDVDGEIVEAGYLWLYPLAFRFGHRGEHDETPLSRANVYTSTLLSDYS